MGKSVGRTFERWAVAVFFIKGGPRYMVIHVDLAKQCSQVSGFGTGDAQANQICPTLM